MTRRHFIKTAAGLLVPSVIGLVKAQGLIINPFNFSGGGGGAPSYLVEENFEGAGTPSGWSTAGTGTIDFDGTGVVLQGAQSLRLTASSQTPRALSPTFSAVAEVWVYAQVHLVSLPSITLGIFLVKNGSSAQVMRVRIGNTGLISIQSATGGANCTDAVSAGTLYHIWAHYLKGTGANAVVDVGFSTDGVRPTSGNKFKQLTNGDATTDAVLVELGHSGSANYDNVYDRFLVDDAQIENSP